MQSDWAQRKLDNISHGYLKLQCPGGECYGNLAVYRICFATTLFVSILRHTIRFFWGSETENVVDI